MGGGWIPLLVDQLTPARDIHVIGIRSKTKLSEKVLREAKNLLVVGCFCIGTNQVDLQYAAKHGIAVFNSPFANSRSVAELVIGEIITLARQLGDRSLEMHRGFWNKQSSKCWEIRGKTLGKLPPPLLTPGAAIARPGGVVSVGYYPWAHADNKASSATGTLALNCPSWPRPWA